MRHMPLAAQVPAQPAATGCHQKFELASRNLLSGKGGSASLATGFPGFQGLPKRLLHARESHSKSLHQGWGIWGPLI